MHILQILRFINVFYSFNIFDHNRRFEQTLSESIISQSIGISFALSYVNLKFSKQFLHCNRKVKIEDMKRLSSFNFQKVEKNVEVYFG